MKVLTIYRKGTTNKIRNKYILKKCSSLTPEFWHKKEREHISTQKVRDVIEKFS